MDHKKPWSLGGRTVLTNAWLTCRACNSRKGNR
ncbi:MAG: HNH endonuclease [Prevotella sp.]|nr:HNH endonuclease [Prevotella sp.]